MDNGETTGGGTFTVESLIENAEALAFEWGPKLLAAVVIFVLGRWIARLLSRLLGNALRKAKVEATLVGFFQNMAYIVLVALVVLAALDKLGVPVTSFAAIIAAAGFAVGFALQGSLANFAAGVMLVFFQPFKAGDLVEVAGTYGRVVAVQLFATTLITPDGKRVIIANNSITAGNIVNRSAEGKLRVEMTFGIGYDDDIKAAKAIMEDILAKDARVLKSPAPTVAVSELADSSVNFAVYPWVHPKDYWGVWFDTHEAVKLQLDAAGISIPFPQQDVHMHQAA